MQLAINNKLTSQVYFVNINVLTIISVDLECIIIAMKSFS